MTNNLYSDVFSLCIFFFFIITGVAYGEKKKKHQTEEELLSKSVTLGWVLMMLVRCQLEGFCISLRIL